MPILVERPAVGRVFEGVRRVRLADVSPAGRVRLDAAARYLQDLSADDTADANAPEKEAWVVRRTVIEVRSFPRYLEAMGLATWCSGTGTHWAERRISIVGDGGGAIEAATIWVHFDPATGRPRRVPDGFDAIYGEAAGGRRVKARLVHPECPAPATATERFGWPLRFSDFDVLSHVNNTSYWQVVEEVLSARRDLRAPLRAEMEHRLPVERGATVEVAVATDEEGSVTLWLRADGVLAATARVVSQSTRW